MLVEYPEYYNKFRCIADRCPDTCCAGWEVDLDEDAVSYYGIMPGPLGERIRACMKTEGEFCYFPLTKEGRCPFLDEKGLCEIILQAGDGSICQTCREYPRYYVQAGSYEQRDMSLSCPEVCRLVLDAPLPFRWIKEETDESDYEESDLTPEGNRRLQEILRERDLEIERLQGRIPVKAIPAKTRGQHDVPRERPDDRYRSRQCTDQEAEEQKISQYSAVRKIYTYSGDDRNLCVLLRKMEPISKKWTALRDELVREMESAASVSSENNGGGRDTAFGNAKKEGTGSVGESQSLRDSEENLLCLEGSRLDEWMTKIAVALTYRYWIDAWFTEDGDIASSRRLRDRLLRLTFLLCALRSRATGAKTPGPEQAHSDILFAGAAEGAALGSSFARADLEEIARIISREVEHDEDNLALLKGICG